MWVCFSCNYFFLIRKKLGVDRPWPLMTCGSFFEEILMRKGILESLLVVCMASSCSQIGYPSTVWFCFVYWLPSVYRITMCVICNWVTCWFFFMAQWRWYKHQSSGSTQMCYIVRITVQRAWFITKAYIDI